MKTQSALIKRDALKLLLIVSCEAVITLEFNPLNVWSDAVTVSLCEKNISVKIHFTLAQKSVHISWIDQKTSWAGRYIAWSEMRPLGMKQEGFIEN